MISTRAVRSLLSVSPRYFGTTSAVGKWKITEKTENDTTTVQVETVNDGVTPRKPSDPCALCTCNTPHRITYKDVLILEQFMREDGTVLPRQLTGLCKKQQLILERCVMQAHWAGLFPDKTIPEFDRSGYKRFNRYWKNDMSMYQLEKKVEHGTWFYIKRYQTKNQRLAPNPLN